MAGLAFLSKKSWHVSNISNQEKVWLAEQKAASEAQKTKELQEQIKAEREREEFDKLANKKSVGDRGTNWMYEGHGVSGEDAGANKSEAVQAVEDAKNEAYLLGKEYVPEGQAKNSGDFALASTMTGALEKASTYGATIGVGTNNNTEGGDGSSSTLRIQDSGTTTAVSSGGLVDDHNTEWNQEFHLRHEDPMFAVQQKQNKKLKDVEKKKRLMERAGLEAVMVKGIDDGNNDGKGKRLREDHEESYERHQKKKKKRKHHSKSSRKSKKSRKYKKRKHRDRSASYSSEESYSSSSSVSSRGRRDGDRYHHRGKHDGRRHRHRHSSSRRGRGKDDDYSSSSSRYGYKSRSRSIDRNYTREDRYADGDGDDDGSRKRSSGGRHSNHHHHRYRQHGRRSRSPSYSRSRSRDEKKHSSSMRERANGDNLSNNDDDRKNNQRHHDDKYDRNYDNNHDKDDASKKKKPPGYGLIGTSLSDRNDNNNSSTTKQQPKQDDYLGPNQKLLAAKRDEIERERQSRLEEAGRGSGKGGGDGYSREERLKEMERTARDRLR